MESFGAELVVHGRDFDEAKAYAARLAEERGLHFVPSFDRELVKGVATYALELFRAVPELETVYAPIGMGSGICGLIAVRDLLGLKTEIVGVVAEAAPAVALSVEAGHPVPTNSAQTFADGMACREPDRGRSTSSARARRAWFASTRTRSPKRSASTGPPRTMSPKARVLRRSRRCSRSASACEASASA